MDGVLTDSVQLALDTKMQELVSIYGHTATLNSMVNLLYEGMCPENADDFERAMSVVIALVVIEFDKVWKTYNE